MTTTQVTQRRNRKQLRHSIGMLLGAVRQEAGGIESSPSAVSQNPVKISDESLAYGGDNEHRGRWVYATAPNGEAHIRRVFASSREERSLTVSQPFPSLPDSTWVYELWDMDMPPGTVHEFINQAISGVTRKGSVEEVDQTFHTGGHVKSFNIPTGWTGVKEISWRSGFTGKQVAPLDDAPTALGVNATASADTADFRQGTAAAKVEIADAAAAGEALAESAFAAAVDARGYDRLEFWHKSNTGTTSSNLTLQLRQGAATHDTAPVPAANGGEWRYASVPLQTPSQNSALNAVRFSVGSSDAGPVTAWFDDVKLVRANSELWHRIPRESWRIDAALRQFTLVDEARFPYARLRVSGVRAPLLLETDSGLCEVDSQYVVNAAAAGLLRSRGDRRGADRDAAMQQADLFEQIANMQRLRMNTPANTRWVQG